MSSGYSGTPLARKLGFKPGTRVVVVGAVPDEYRAWVAPLPDGTTLSARGKPPYAAVHLFVTTRSDLARHLTRLRATLAQDGYLWVSWPKKSAGVPTDVTEDTIRAAALPLGFVDIKVCAVSAVWSGLKLVIRVALRR